MGVAARRRSTAGVPAARVDDSIVRWPGRPAAADARGRAESILADVRDDPAKRLALAMSFYRPVAPGRSLEPYQRAEIAFMRWQIRRGVLTPPGSDPPGSPWWRAVNGTLLRDTVEARLLVLGGPGTPSTPAVRHWIEFLRHPSPECWYRAHNASIVAGYLDSRQLIDGERPLERLFMDVALLRVLYAHSLLAHPRFALGRLAGIGPLLGDPRRRAADLFLSLQNVLPAVYPLMVDSVDEVLAAENPLARVIDFGVIAPRIAALYALAAADLDEPRLVDLQQDGWPVYAWPVADAQVWQAVRSRAGIAVVRAALGPAARR